ncbi:MAG: Gfo/Idh/MocA family oxidoreductase [bacterium]
MLKMAVIGLGMGGSYGARIHASKTAQFVAMCDSNPERLATRAKTYKAEIGAEPHPYTNVEELLRHERLDGVVISTPSATHHLMAEQVAAAGVSMLIDKPLDISSEHMDRIASAVTRNQVLCGVNYPLRCNPLLRGIKKAIDDGLLGKPLICDIRLKWYRDQAYYDRGGWRGTWAMDGGGSLMNQGAHYMDVLCWFMGRPVHVMGAFAALDHRIETEDWASGIVEFENSVRATVSTATCVQPRTDANWIEVHGTKGSIFVKDHAVVSSSTPDLERLAPCPFEHPVEDFIDAVQQRRQPLVSIEQGRWSVDLINAVYRSAREGRRVAASP